MNSKSLIAEATYFFATNFVPLALASALPVLLLWSIPDAVYSVQENTRWHLALIALYILVVYPISSAATLVVTDQLANDEPLTWSGVMAASLRVWWPMMTMTLIKTVLLTAGMLLLIIPGIWLYVRLVLSEPYVALRGAKPMDAINNSFRTTQGIGWTLFGALGVFSLFAGGFGYLVSLVPAEPALLNYLSWVFSVLEMSLSALFLITAYRALVLVENATAEPVVRGERE